MAEVEIAGAKIKGGKMLLLLPILGTLGGGLWGGFEFYKDYLNMKEQIQNYVAPDLSEFDKNIVFLLKPTTFMNNSGLALKEIRDFYNIDINNIYVIHDEIDLSQGIVKVKNGGGHNGHNGLKSIDNFIGKNYNRVRVGVSRPSKIYKENVDENISNWVLSDFTSDEKKQWLDKTIIYVSEMVVSLIKNQSDFLS